MSEPTSPSAEKTFHITILDAKDNVLLELEAPKKWSSFALKSSITDACRVPGLCQMLTLDGGVIRDGVSMEEIYVSGKSVADDSFTLKMEKNFSELNACLKSEHPNQRQLAVQALAELATAEDYEFAFERLAAAVSDADVDVRRVAVEGLVRMTDLMARQTEADITLKRMFGTHTEECAKALSGAVADCMEDVRQQGYDALNLTSRHNKKAIAAMKTHLKHHSRCVRVTAARTLALISMPEDKDVMVALAQSFEDPDSGVRLEAAKSLVKVGSLQIVQKLCTLCSNKCGEIQRLALETLPKIAPPQPGKEVCADAIAAALAHLHEPLNDVRLTALRALHGLVPEGHDAAIVALCGKLGRFRKPLPPPKPPKKKRAADSDSDDESEDSDEDSEASGNEEDDDDGKKKKKRKKKEQRPPTPIVHPPEDTDPQVRKAALEALADLAPRTDAQVFDILLYRFTDPAPEVRRAAMVALTEKFALKDDERLVPILVKLTNSHANGDVRWLAVRALAKVVQSRIDNSPTYAAIPGATEDEQMEKARAFVNKQQQRIQLINEKLEEVRSKKRSTKTRKSKRMFKATLLRITSDKYYIHSRLRLAENDEERLREFVKSHEDMWAEAKQALKLEKRRDKVKEFKQLVKEFETNEEYHEALKEIEEIEELKAKVSGKPWPPVPPEGEGAAETKAPVVEIPFGPPKDLPDKPPNADAAEAEAEEEEEPQSETDNEGLEDEDVYRQYLESEDEEEREEVPPPPLVPAGPVTALVHRVKEDGSLEVVQAAVEALTKLAAPGRKDVIDALRPLADGPLSTHADLRVAAIECLLAKVQKNDKELLQVCWKRSQDRDDAVREVSLRGLEILMKGEAGG
eukprot:TRINITY_DN23513_c0_g1_i1.p1 TRINITY_DN23513_c0_g1~~TRINITY_DN23513_c0_g1_i1.p1  ORF type:complete len:861 (-),score=251.81 TRINITY_DN23513_c0_g1_i1:172-2754(-)